MATSPVFLPGESHGQRSLVGYSPWGHKESERLKQPSTHARTFKTVSQATQQHPFLSILKHLRMERISEAKTCKKKKKNYNQYPQKSPKALVQLSFRRFQHAPPAFLSVQVAVPQRSSKSFSVIPLFLIFHQMKEKVLIPQSCLTLCNPMDCSPPGSSVHRILQASMLSGLLLPTLQDLPKLGIEPGSPASQAVFFLPSEPPRNSF